MRTIFLGFLCVLAAGALEARSEASSDDLGKVMEKCMEVLQREFREQKGWIKVHAAEAMLGLGSKEFVRNGWKLEREDDWSDGRRIGFWRVSARCADTPAERAQWIRRIEDCFADEHSPHRLVALESLCKLSFHSRGDTLRKLKVVASDATQPDATFGRWALKLAGEPGMDQSIADVLQSPDPKLRKLAAFSLLGAGGKDPAALAVLAAAADREPAGSIAAPFVLSAALALRADESRESEWKSRIQDVLAQGDGNSRYIVCQTLRDRFTEEDLKVLEPVLAHSDPDARIGAAMAITEVFRKTRSAP